MLQQSRTLRLMDLMMAMVCTLDRDTQNSLYYNCRVHRNPVFEVLICDQCSVSLLRSESDSAKNPTGPWKVYCST